MGNHRDAVISSLWRLKPRIVTLVEEDDDLDVGLEGFEFVKGFEECLRWFRVYFKVLDESFPRTSKEGDGEPSGVFDNIVGGATRDDNTMGEEDA